MPTYTIEFRCLTTVNTDPQRRCYNGCHASQETRWTPWDWLELEVPDHKLEARLAFWRDLNDYAVEERGDTARKEFRAVQETTHG